MKVAIALTLTFIIVPYKIISLIFKTDLNSDVIIELNNVYGMLKDIKIIKNLKSLKLE